MKVWVVTREYGYDGQDGWEIESVHQLKDRADARVIALKEETRHYNPLEVHHNVEEWEVEY